MPRTARTVIPNIPHHVVQRGNRKQPVFFSDNDFKLYLSLLKEKTQLYGTKIIAYCLMDNHVHLILEPNADSLQAVAEIHKAYSRFINKREGWTGHFWQGRFSSYPMDGQYMYHAIRYVELNPVFAGLVKMPEDYRWSSARQRLEIENGHMSKDLKVIDRLKMSPNEWKAYWYEGIAKIEMNTMFIKNEKSQESLFINSNGDTTNCSVPKGQYNG